MVKNDSPTSTLNKKYVADKKTIANEMNNYFTNIPSQISPVTQNSNDDTTQYSELTEFVKMKLPEDTNFSIPPIRLETVYKYLTNLNTKKSTCPDLIGPKFLKMSAAIITEPLTQIINLSIAKGEIPEQ